MKKIVNWTFGSVFRTFGRVIAYILLGILASVFISKMGLKIPSLGIIYRVNASTITTSGKQFRVRAYMPDNDSYNYSSWVDMNEWLSTSSGEALTDAIRVKFLNSDNFNSTTDYLLHMRVETQTPTIGNTPLRSVACHGITNTSSWNENSDYLSTCEIVNISVNSGYTDYQIHFKPNRNLPAIQSTIYFKELQSFAKVRVLSSSFIETISSQSDIVNNQTNTIINNQNQNTQDVINNQNENTNKIVDELSTKCPNLYNGSSHTSTNLKVALDLSNLTSGKTYTLSTDLPIYVAKFSQTDQNATGSVVGPEFWNSNGKKSWTFTYTGNKYLYLDLTSSAGSHFITNISEISLYHIMVVEGSESKPYCKYGSTTNKIDNLNDNIGHISGGIHDLETNIMDDQISVVEIENGLNYEINDNAYGPFGTFLNFPITWVRTLLVDSNTCNPLLVPLPFLDNKYLVLPCMDEFWNQMGSLDTLITFVWYCVIGVRIFNGLFLLVVRTTSSKDNFDELTELKTWEL